MVMIVILMTHSWSFYTLGSYGTCKDKLSILAREAWYYDDQFMNVTVGSYSLWG